MFSCEFCEISKNTFPYRTLPVLASVLIVTVLNITYLNVCSLSENWLISASNSEISLFPVISDSIYLFKVNNSNTRKMCEICSKLTIKTREWRHGHHYNVFIVNFEYVSHFSLVFLLLTLNKEMFAGISAEWIFEYNKHLCFWAKFWKQCVVFGQFVHDDHGQKAQIRSYFVLKQ